MKRNVTDCEWGGRRGGRPAFSLVELLVAMALIVFIMSILSWAFSAAAKTFTDLKAAGDLAEKLRGVMTMVRRDLAAQHFVGPAGSGSQQLVSEVAGPPSGGGYFRIYQGLPAPAQWPASGGTAFEPPAFVNFSAALQFTVALPGVMPADFFTTTVPNLNQATQPIPPIPPNPMPPPGSILLDPFWIWKNTALPPPSPAGLSPAGFTTPTWASNFTAVPLSTTVSPSAFSSQDQRYQPIPTTANSVPTGVLKSKFAEVIWWLTPSVNPDGSANGTPAGTSIVGSGSLLGQPLYTLCRRQRLVWSEPPVSWPTPTPPTPPTPWPFSLNSPTFLPFLPINGVRSVQPGNGHDEISAPTNFVAVPAPPSPSSANIQLNDMVHLTMPPYRFGMSIVQSPYQGPLVVPTLPPPPPTYLPIGATYAGVTFTPATTFTTTAFSSYYPSPFTTPAGMMAGRVDDIVLDNVLSFDVQVLLRGDTQFRHLNESQVQAFAAQTQNPAFPPTGPWVYDSWSNQPVQASLPVAKTGAYDYVTSLVATSNTPRWKAPGTFASMPLWRNANNFDISIQAIQVTLRLWDPKTMTTRQVSMVQAM